MIHIIRTAYAKLIVNQEREISFWVLTAFLPTFLAIRTLVYFQPTLFVNVNGTHVHHLTCGILLLALAGYLGLTVQTPNARPRIAAVYGFGLALAFDEFGMWLLLRDDYWIRQSYDALFIILALLINVVYFGDFWLHLLRHFFRSQNRASPLQQPSKQIASN